MKIGLFHDLTISEWEQCINFLEKMDSLLVEADCSWRHRMDEEAPDVDEEYRTEFEEIRDEYSQELNEFKVILTNSSFVYSYSLFEHRMIRMCDRLKATHNFSSSIGSRPNLGDVKKYIRRYYGKKLFCDTEEWSTIQKYREIRNRIVHYEATVPSDWKLLTYAENKGIIADRDKSRLEITRPFCEDAVNIFKRFMRMVCEADPTPTVTTRAQIREFPATGTDSHGA